VNGDGPPVVPATGSPPPWRTAVRRRLGLPLIAATALTGLFGAGFASAASVSSTTDTLTANRIAVPRCSTAGIQIFEAVSGSPTVVNTVYVNNVDAACAGGTLSLTLNSGGGTTVSASTTVPAGGGLMTITLSPAPTLVVGNEVDFVVTGP
jgi:hypothetical protein